MFLIDIKLSNERSLVTFDPSEQVKISKAIQELKPDNSLTEFTSISEMIKKATGMLPADLTPTLQQLSGSYSKMTMTIKTNFADATAILSNLVLKGYRVLGRGMNKDDKKVLMNFEKQLKSDILNTLHEFVESSRSELVEIHKQLLVKAHGDRATDLLNKMQAIDTDLLKRAENLKAISSESGKIQGQIESYAYEKQVFEKAVRDSDAAKEEARKYLRDLRAQIPEYENKVLQHRNTYSHSRSRFFIFTWRSSSVYNDNGESTARENLNRLLSRISALEKTITDWPKTDLVERVTTARNNLAIAEEKNRSLANEYARVQRSYDKVQQDFDDTNEEIKGIYKLVGTSSLNSLKLIDELSRAVQSGSESIVAAYGKIRLHLKIIGVDEDFLVNSIIDALQFINMADAYMGTTRIHNTKLSLGIQ